MRAPVLMAMPGDTIQQPIMAGAANPQPFVIGSGDQAGKSRAEIDEQVTFIVQRLSTLANEQVTAKEPVERRWLESVRAYHGYYDPDTERALKDAKQSRAYAKVTRAKTVALEARMVDLIFPTEDRNWGIQATPVPKLSKEYADATKKAELAADNANRAENDNDPVALEKATAEGNDQAARAAVAEEEIKKARAAAEAMQDEMEDQLVESLYPQESRDMIHDACMLGPGILKGPMVNQSTRGRWMPVQSADGEQGVYALEQHADPRPLVKRVDPWSFFPDMSARRIEEAEFTFERYLWTKKDLRKMVQTHGFNPDAVRRLLNGEKRGAPTSTAATSLQYMTQLRSLTGDTANGQITNRFIGWEYHGSLECDEVAALLRSMGRDKEADEFELRDDPLEDFRVICFFCENELLKIAPEYPLDSGETLYSVFNVEESEASIFGYGIPHIMGDSAHALNASWRMALDNSALSVGPQAIIDKSVIAPADGDWTMIPKKIWLRIKAAVGKDEAKPIEFFNIPNNMAEISSIIKIALDFIDMETGLPMPQQGEQGAHTTQTFGGMAILANSANIIFRRIVKNYDDGIITPTMRRLYDWNMQHSTRAEIKGDMSVDARGTSVLLQRELQAQNLMFIVANLMNNPNIAPMLKPYDNVKKLFQALLISPADVMQTEDDYNAALKKISEQEQPKDPATINAESRIQAATISAESRKNSDAMQMQIAQLKERTALIELATSRDLTLEELRNDLQIKTAQIESGERKMAVEVGVEQQMADQAHARGEEPTGSGGYVSAGAKKVSADA